MSQLHNNCLATRMKRFEDVNRHYLSPKTPVIMRIDGKAFHSLTKHADKPFDHKLMHIMSGTADCLLATMQGSKAAYTQSDEISILLSDLDRNETQGWFDHNIQKMVSVGASMATAYFQRTREGVNWRCQGFAMFDCRVFSIPEWEVKNYFLWRYHDATRNSLQALAQSIFSHKELQCKKAPDLHKMLHAANVNWADLPYACKNGAFTTMDSGGINGLNPHLEFDFKTFDFAGLLHPQVTENTENQSGA